MSDIQNFHHPKHKTESHCTQSIECTQESAENDALDEDFCTQVSALMESEDLPARVAAG